MNRTATNKIQLLSAMLALMVAGCFGDNKVSVSGKVTYGGQPIEQGTIRFAPADGQGPTDGGTIDDGAYQVEVTPGRKKVHIEGHKQIGEEKQNPADPSSPLLPVYEPIVNTDVTAEISASRDDLNFDLPSP